MGGGRFQNLFYGWGMEGGREGGGTLSPANFLIIHSRLAPKAQKKFFNPLKIMDKEKKNLNCVISCQFWRYAHGPEVFTTSRRGCFELSQTDRQTWQLYD